ncbi:3-deoxy-D-manno-octulosonic acid transferase [Desulfonema ishimotonii]|uniref:3-deoxy-D-manno-octulosonic acid transferase n=2 Tax=Desulfonema ishimotonii TaxID=45657 RepID=A0A401G3Y4_9BACT|nr:3-deoxy-D-manno-octulosonic acid transferase [Desulfonema ishimotonii]
MMPVYNFLLIFFMILGLPVLIPLVLHSPKRRATVLQRLGLRGLPEKPARKRRIWVHALSVGEVISAVPLVRAMKTRFPDHEILFSAATKTGFETATAQIGPQVARIFFFPLDILFSVRRVIRRVAPEFVIIVETDIWPNFLAEARRRDIPVFLVNTRLSTRSFRGYRRFSFFTGPVFRMFTRICPQSGADAQRFLHLGVPPEQIVTTGNMKFDQPADPVPAERIAQMRSDLHIRPEARVLVAGSTHAGEEEQIRVAWIGLKKALPDLCLIVAPRNPERADAVCRIFSESGLKALPMKSAEQTASEGGWDVMAVDRIGVLRSLYALGEIAFVGGSLVALGGHNPLEPAAFGKPVLFGSHMADFAEISALLLAEGGAVQVTDAASFRRETLRLFENTAAASETGKRALRVFTANRGAVARTLDVIGRGLET